MNFPTIPLQGAAGEPNVLGPFLEGVSTLVNEFWWVPALLGIFIIVRAYIDHSNAQQGDVSEQGLLAVPKFLLSTGYGFVLGIGGLFAGILYQFGILAQITPFVAWGIGSGDPITLASVAAGVVAAGASLDIPGATPSNAIIAFAAVGFGLLALDAMDNAADSVEDEDDD